MTLAQRLASAARKRGFTAEIENEADDCVDAEVRIEGIPVQVGADATYGTYYIMVHEYETPLCTVSEVLAQIKQRKIISW